MAPPPEYDKEPKAPDKSATTVTNEEIKVHTLVNDLPTFSDHKTANSASNNETENNKHVESLDDGQLRALLDEAIQYKCPKDREGKSSLFKELLEEVEHQDEVSEAASRGFIARGGPHANSLQDLMAALKAESTSRPVRHQPPPHSQTSVSARAIHGGSLPSGVDTSFLLAEEPARGGYLATVRCVNPPPLAERRVSASDANTPAEMELLNKRNKPMFPMYTARASLEIGSGSVCSGRAVTTTTPSNQVVPRPTHCQRATRGPPQTIFTYKVPDQPEQLSSQERLCRALQLKCDESLAGNELINSKTRDRGSANEDTSKIKQVVLLKKPKSDQTQDTVKLPLKSGKGKDKKLKNSDTNVADKRSRGPQYAARGRETKYANSNLTAGNKGPLGPDYAAKRKEKGIESSDLNVGDKNPSGPHYAAKGKDKKIVNSDLNVGGTNSDVPGYVAKGKEKKIGNSDLNVGGNKPRGPDYADKVSLHCDTKQIKNETKSDMFANTVENWYNSLGPKCAYRSQYPKTSDIPVVNTKSTLVSNINTAKYPRYHQSQQNKDSVTSSDVFDNTFDNLYKVLQPSCGDNGNKMDKDSNAGVVNMTPHCSNYTKTINNPLLLHGKEGKASHKNSEIHASSVENWYKTLPYAETGMNKKNEVTSYVDNCRKASWPKYGDNKGPCDPLFLHKGKIVDYSKNKLVDNFYNGSGHCSTPLNINNANFRNFHQTKTTNNETQGLANYEIYPDIDPNIEIDDIAKGFDNYYAINRQFKPNLLDINQTDNFKVTNILSQEVCYDITEYRKRVGKIYRTPSSSNNPRNIKCMTIGKPEEMNQHTIKPDKYSKMLKINKSDRKVKQKCTQQISQNILISSPEVIASTGVQSENKQIKSEHKEEHVETVKGSGIEADVAQFKEKSMKNKTDDITIQTIDFVTSHDEDKQLDLEPTEENIVEIGKEQSTITNNKIIKEEMSNEIEETSTLVIECGITKPLSEDNQTEFHGNKEIECSKPSEIKGNETNNEIKNDDTKMETVSLAEEEYEMKDCGKRNNDEQEIELIDVAKSQRVDSDDIEMKYISQKPEKGQNVESFSTFVAIQQNLFQCLESVNYTTHVTSATEPNGEQVTTEKTGQRKGKITNTVDSTIPFSCITTPEVVASCNTTSSTAQSSVAVDPKPRSVISSTFNGLPLSRPNYGATASAAADEYKKSLDENGNAVQGIGSPVSGSSQHKKPRRKKSSKNETVIKSHQIDGYQGNKDINEVLRFIESNADAGRGGKLRGKHKDDDDKGKKRSTERRKAQEKGKRASSLEELSRTKLEDLTDEPEPPPAKPERRSWGDDARDYYRDEPPPDHDFQTVTKRRKPRRDRNDRDERPAHRPRPPEPRARRESAPPSDRSNDSNDDMDSVHSLPAPPRAPLAAPHASYADIARTRHNIPDLIESCNFYAEGEGAGDARKPEPAPQPGDADGYPALEPRAAPRRPPKPAPPAPRRKDRVPLAPDVVADRRPPVILLDSHPHVRDMDGVTFGFDINEQLLGGPRRPRCDLVRDAPDAAEPAEPRAGPGEPRAGPDEPRAGPDEPRAGPGEPRAGPAAVAVAAGCAALRYMPPDPPPDTHHLHQIIDYVGAAWEDVIRCGAGKVRYFSE